MSAEYAGELDGNDLFDVVRGLSQLRGSLGRRALDVRNAGTQRRAAFRQLEHRRAQVRSSTSGTVQAKNDATLLDEDCIALWAAFDLAEETENYTKNMARSDASDVSNLQTQARLIEAQLKLAGTPDRRLP